MDLKAEARRLAEDTSQFMRTGPNHKNTEDILSALLAFGRLVREEDLGVIDHNEETAALALPGWETGYAAALRSMDKLIRDRAKALE